MRPLALSLALGLALLVLAPVVAEEAAPAPAPAPAAKIAQAWRPLPKIEGETFRFLVMADNQPHGMPERFDVRPEFERIVAEANHLAPDLVLLAGDLIFGYEGDRGEVGRMWDLFDEAVGKLKAPFRMAPGNHCIWDQQSEDVWKERYGPTYHAFSVGGCRFLSLDTEESFGRTDQLSAEQIDWLEKEVAGAKSARHLFVYLHKPLWRFDPGRGPWMETVHPILKRHPSVVVLGGHFHAYERSNDRDGIRYYVAPAAGGPISGAVAAGEFHGYLHVSVQGDDVTVAPVRLGSVLPDTFLREDRRQAIYEIGQSIDLEPLVIGDGSRKPRRPRVTLLNHLPESLDVVLTVLDPGSWKSDTTEARFPVNPGVSESVELELTPGESVFPPPRVRIVGRVGEDVLVQQEMLWPVSVQRRLEIVRAKAAPKIDGILDDDAWKTAKPAGRFVRIQGDAFAKRGTDWRAVWDDENLYLAFAMEEPNPAALVARATERDWMGVFDDAVIFYLDFVRDGQSRFCFGANAGGAPMEYRAPGGAVDIPWSGPWKQVVKKTEKGWIMEVAIPWTTLGFEPGVDKTFAVASYRKANPGEPVFSGWTLPAGGRLSNPAGFGEAVLK